MTSGVNTTQTNTSTTTSTTPTDTPTATTNGSVTFIQNQDNVVLQANRDIAGFYAYLSEQEGAGPHSAPGVRARLGDAPAPLDAATNAAIVSAGSSVINTAIQAANLGVNIANTVLSQKTTSTLQIAITNNSMKALTLYDYTPSSCDISNLPNSLYTGQTDTVVVTKNGGFSTGNDASSVLLLFGIGNGEPIDTTRNSMILFSLAYTYSDTGDPGRWEVTASVDGCPPCSYPGFLQLFGLTFAANDGYPGFSVYTSPIETGGAIAMTVYDR